MEHATATILWWSRILAANTISAYQEIFTGLTGRYAATGTVAEILMVDAVRSRLPCEYPEGFSFDGRQKHHWNLVCKALHALRCTYLEDRSIAGGWIVAASCDGDHQLSEWTAEELLEDFTVDDRPLDAAALQMVVGDFELRQRLELFAYLLNQLGALAGLESEATYQALEICAMHLRMGGKLSALDIDWVFNLQAKGEEQPCH